MCGIAGFLGGVGQRGVAELGAILESMGGAIRHRGPDGDGTWLDPACGVGLAHRRLAIIDLSVAGRQPMESRSGRWVVSFNGEIYNHAQMRADLERSGRAPPWRGRSDTETLVASFDAAGIVPTLKACVGMFAIAVWDREERALTLARDRYGEKPLYYGRSGGSFIFGSQLRALRAHPDFDARIDRGALALFLRHNYVPGPFSVYEGYRKLPPGSILTIGADSAGIPVPEPFWRLRDVVLQPRHDRMSDEEAIGRLDNLLRGAIAGQLVADVPIGAFLSGGIDSSLTVALMQAEGRSPVRTFTIGFDDRRFDESPYARAVADHLGTDHTELRVTGTDALAVIPELPGIYDEPFADSSQIPTVLVSRLARQGVSVALSGDGGDEVFGGYTRYRAAGLAWAALSRIPAPIRGLLARGVLQLPVGAWDALGAGIRPLSPAGVGSLLHGDRLHKVAGVLGSRDAAALYLGLVSHWGSPEAVVRAADEPSLARDLCERWFGSCGTLSAMMGLDASTYLPDDILVKVDRAAMHVGLETRAPLLDHRISEFAWRLPDRFRIRGGRSKWLLRKVLERYVPARLFERPKAGFGVPLGTWLRGPLREWAEELLAEDRLAREGFFHPAPIRRKWVQHLRGEREWHYHLWDVLMFQAWLEETQGVQSVKRAS